MQIEALRTLKVSIDDGVCHVIMNRPHKGMHSKEMVNELVYCLEEAAHNQDIE